MTTTATLEKPSALANTLRRLRLVIGVGFAWAVHVALDQYVLHTVPDAPRTFSLTAGALALPAAALGSAAALVLGAWLAGRRDLAGVLLVTGLTWALWAMPGGNMDDWLRRTNTRVTTPTAAAYGSLLTEYLALAVAAGAAALVTARGTRRAPTPGSAAAPAPAQPNEWLVNWPRGVSAMLICTGVAVLALQFLQGPRVAWTYRGQVYFAVLFSFFLGAFAADRALHVRGVAWLCLAPLLTGLLGTLQALAQPSLPGEYAHLNGLPAHPLVRPLPIEMLALGLLGILWAAHSARERRAAEAEV